jgi:hypothetical protein
MLYSKLTGCSGSNDISSLLDRINCKLVKLGSDLYANTVYMMNNHIPTADLIDLLIYKRILTFKQVNPDYCSNACYGEMIGDVIQWNDINLIHRPPYTPWWYRIIRNGILSDTVFADILSANTMIATITVSNQTTNAFPLIIYLTDGTELLNETIESFGLLTLTLNKPINSTMGINVTSISWNGARINISLTIENPF